MSMNTVTVTEHEGLTNPEVTKEFFSIFKEIFPPQVEQRYVKLATLLERYTEQADKILSSSKNLDKVGDELHDLEQSNANAIAELTALEAVITKLKSSIATNKGQVTMSEYTDFGEAYDKCFNSLGGRTRREQQIATLETNYDSYRMDAGNAHVEISNLYSEIAAKLAEIENLGVDKSGSLDRIMISESRHLARIDNIKLSEGVKATLKELLNSYVNLRKNAFRTLINHAYEVVSAYKAIEIINYRKQDDPRVYNFKLGHFALTWIETVFQDCIEHLVALEDPAEDFNIERGMLLVKMMQWYNSYFSTDVNMIDMAELDSDMAQLRKDPHYLDINILNTLRNIILSAQNKLGKPRN